jgi:hypothetical protein
VCVCVCACVRTHAHGKRECNRDFRQCVLGDSLRISTHSRVFTLFLRRPRAQFRPTVHLILEVSRSRKLDTHTHTHQLGLPCKSDQLVADAATYATKNKHFGPTYKPKSGFENVLKATKQIDQQDRRLLIYCTLNSLFLNTLSWYDVINCFKIST